MPKINNLDVGRIWSRFLGNINIILYDLIEPIPKYQQVRPSTSKFQRLCSGHPEQEVDT